jgi:hypothetical protein
MTSPLIQPDEFSQALLLLPADLHDRARNIRSCVLRAGDCPYCRIADHSLQLALRAAVFDQHDWARTLVAEAEHYVDAGRHPRGCPSHDGPALPDRRPRTGVHGQIERWAGAGQVIAATESFDATARAADPAKSFLLSWHQTALAV